MNTLCAHCLLEGKKWPSRTDHVGLHDYARHAKTVFSGDALCEDHAKTAVRAFRKECR